MKESNIAKLFGGEFAHGFDSLGGPMHDDEEISSLLALTEEQELQLAYEERIKAEHEEARSKKQEKLKEKLKEQKNFKKMIAGGFDNNDSDSSSDEG